MNDLKQPSRRVIWFAIVAGTLIGGELSLSFSQDQQKPPVGKAEQPPAKQPPQAMPLLGGQNLFGEPVDAAAQDAAAANPNSQCVRRAKVMIERVLEIDSDIQYVQSKHATRSAEKIKLEADLQQLPKQHDALQAEAIRLINFPTREELRTRKQRLTIIQVQSRAIRERINQSELRVRTLGAELQQGEQQTKKLFNDALELQHGWGKLLSILDYLPPSDARQIEALCQRKLDQYPEAHTVRMMQGFARIHLGRLQTAKQDLQHCNQALNNAPQPLYTPFKIRCLVGIGWIEIQLGNLGPAAAQLAEARQLNSQDYEAAVCVSHLAHLRQRSDTALTLYSRATTLDSKPPAGFRMAAEMVCQSKVRPADFALKLAQHACQVDEFGDFRNQLALARAHHYAGNAEAMQSAVKHAKQQAGKEATALVAKVEAELTANR
ncbi:hypothetical protein [Roseimaritima ulvae]|uniref:Tetratricopeptide repeat protein n=1 Tax=Roseimaritima ulvae TaxID=980254 RepID=A0A5B9QMG2_9BACT|nr:hypothetical protein [Roseimaritima ulvae]QEG39259.1 hypothetical protein UC8_12200 [Roseimaritima ulvae]